MKLAGTPLRRIMLQLDVWFFERNRQSSKVWWLKR